MELEELVAKNADRIDWNDYYFKINHGEINNDLKKEFQVFPNQLINEMGAKSFVRFFDVNGKEKKLNLDISPISMKTLPFYNYDRRWGLNCNFGQLSEKERRAVYEGIPDPEYYKKNLILKELWIYQFNFEIEIVETLFFSYEYYTLEE